ncbi:MAG TPA: ATP-binding protein [Actinomycetota bacterium]
MRAPLTPLKGFLGSLIEGTLDDSSNLIGNAVKYSPADRPIVVSVSPDIRGGHAVVSVADEGAGLGLYIARRLAEAMSGRLWVEGNAGGGSTFAFALPLSVTVLEHRSEPADALLTG